ncbi:MAG: sulfatase-like hydrolase/transferase [Bacteroidota bacterium]
MSSKKKLILRGSLIPFLGILGAYLFWPLTSDRFEITFDQKKIEGKEEYLSRKVSSTDTTRPPNIVIIMADDLGKAEVSIYGQDLVQTPNIDAIARNGVLFTEGYITSPICSPSRAGLITGRYQQRFGYELQPHDRYPKNMAEYLGFKYFVDTDNWVLADEEVIYPKLEDILKQGLPPSEITMAELLKKRNYKTGIIGKWHLGFSEFSFPLQRGFDYFYGFYEAFSLYAYEDDPNIVNHHHEDLFTDKYIWGPGRTGNCAIYRNEEVVEEKEYITKKFAKEAVQFIEDNKEDPFLLYLPFNAPHTPFQATKEDYEAFSHIEDKNKRVYYAMIKALDDAVGKITSKIKSSGLEENTLIVFLSDNGGATYTEATDNQPLKGGKVTNFEGGINIPFMMQWKGNIPEGMVYRKPVISLDLFRTASELAGVPMPSDRAIDGVNLVPYINGEKSDEPHEALYWKAGYNHAIRKGDWKLILNDKDQRTVLYNLLSDKNETTNVASSNPDVVEELKSDLRSWEKDLENPAWPRIMDWQFKTGNEVHHFAM